MTFTRGYRKPSDLPINIAAFPLRGAILLPRVTLPLNIFEPRYLAMIDETLSADRVIGIIQPQGDAEDESSLGKNVPLRKIGCVGRITAYQEMDNGRFIVTLTGITRFDVNKEITTNKPYRMVNVSYDRFKTDFEEGRGEDLVDRQNLLQVLKAYLNANQLSADWSSILKAPSEVLINALSVMSPYGPEEKQALLEADDLKTRADVLVALAEMEMASGGSSGGTLQ